MAHGVYAVQRSRYCLGIAHIADDKFYLRVEIIWPHCPHTVYLGGEIIQCPHLVSMSQ
jgi:hypothetical protein